MPTAFVSHSDQSGQYRSFQGDGHANDRSGSTERRYRDRWRIEAAFCRLKDFRRVATRYDKLAINFLSAVVLAAIIAFWV
jgi:transposase